MSNLLFMDESNGNGGYITSTTTSAATATGVNATISRTINNKIIQNKKNNNNISNGINNNLNNINANINNNINNNHNCNTNNINHIMAAASNAATASTAVACVGGVQLPNSVSNEDLSQSLSEYTDADESISAPTEFLAEFLSAVMLKDYKKALKYCKLILQYEPDNSTAKEFYPLILDKLRGTNTSSDSDENYNKSSSPELILETPSSDPSAGESDEHDEQYLRHKGEAIDGLGAARLAANVGAVKSNDRRDANSNVSSSSSGDDVEEDDEVEGDEEDGCGSIDASLSEEGVEDDDEDDEENDCEDEVDEDDDDVDVDDDIMSSSGDDLPIDEQQILVGDVLDLDGSSANACGEEAAVNISNSSRNSSSGGKVSSRSDNTTHSYSSLLLEEEDDIVPANLHFPKDLHTNDLDVSNGNKVPSASCSDSESPTEPLTQRLAAILRSKCGVTNTNG